MKARLVGGVIVALLLGGTAACGGAADDSVEGEQEAGGDKSPSTAPTTTEPPAPSTTRPASAPDVCMDVVEILGDMTDQEFDLRDEGSERVFSEPKPIEQSAAELEAVDRDAFAKSRRTGATRIRDLQAANPAQEAALADFAAELDRLAQTVTDGAATVNAASDQQGTAYNALVLAGGCGP